MNFAEIQATVADRLNLTSQQALTRIGKSINEKYKELASDLGMQATVRGVATHATTIGSPYLMFTGVEKVFSVFNPAYTQPFMLREVSVEEIQHSPRGTDPPGRYAIYNMGASAVTVLIDSTPTTSYALNANAELLAVTLANQAVPNFSESFHDTLLYGVMEIEYDKMEKLAMAKRMQGKYEGRRADLRFFIAKSPNLQLFQNMRPGTLPVNNRLI